MSATVHRSAVISPDGRYRYRLDRSWGPNSDHLRLPFMMLNPSTADANQDDPTIRRCIGFARREGYDGITVVNLGAFRATNPDDWAQAENPFGPDNFVHVEEVVGFAGIVVAAWGAHPAGRVAAVDYLKLFADLDVRVMCLGRTRDGAPRHPLYVKGSQPLEPLTPMGVTR